MDSEDLFQSVKAALYDRVTSPLWGAFALSWLAWNFSLLVVIFSTLGPDAKFEYIKNHLYPDVDTYALLWIIYPLTTTLIVILVVPALSEPVYRGSRFWKNRLKRFKIEMDGKVPREQDEVNEIIINFEKERRVLIESRLLAFEERDTAIKRFGETQNQILELKAELSKKTAAETKYLTSNEQLEISLKEMAENFAKSTDQLKEITLSRKSLEIRFSDSEKTIAELQSTLDESTRKSESRPSKFETRTASVLRRIVTGGNFELLYNSKSGATKRIEFNQDGTIGEGRNKNEHTWATDSGGLILYTEKGDLQNVFDYDEKTAIFKARASEKVNALPNQLITPVP